MDLIFLYIGFSQALFAFIFILTKRPLKIAYIILGILLLVFALMFGLDILRNYHLIPSHRWTISLSTRMLLAPLFYLYAKYITKDFDKFNPLDFFHALPSISLLSISFVLRLLPENNSLPIEIFYEKYNLLRIIYGWLFFALIVYYVIAAIKIVINFKNQIKDNYSYSSYKISLDWLLGMIILFVVLILLIIISSVMYENGKIDSEVYIFRHVLELFHVYVLSIWGFHQKQLISGFIPESDTIIDSQESSTGKYVKSGLKSEDAKAYVQKLLKYMEESEIWQDPELSIAKLATQTSISKHQLSEALNEYLGKSFYVFVNEYRVEYAKNLMMKKEYSNWSILAIAYECGFNSKTAFNIFFKKHTQLTPSEFKKSITEQQ